MTNIAIFASGNGSNCENIIRYFKDSHDINISLVLCNNPEAKGVKTVKNQMTKAFSRLREALSDGHKPFFLPFL